MQMPASQSSKRPRSGLDSIDFCFLSFSLLCSVLIWSSLWCHVCVIFT